MSNMKSKYDIGDEIDLVEVLKKVYVEKKLIIKYSIISAFVGVVFALLQPNQYTSSTTFIPQLNSEVNSGGSSLSGLASLAGINLGGMEASSGLPPSLYPQVVESVPFRLDLLSTKIQFNDNELTLREYFIEHKKSFDLIGTIKKYTIGLPSLIIQFFNKEIKPISKSSLIYVSEEDQLLFDSLSNLLALSINQKEGFITMSFTDKNNRIAAQIVKIAQTQLQKKIIEFKIKSSKELLDFTVEQYNEKKLNFEILQDKRAIFVDENINISSSLFQNKLNRIESELSIAQNVVQQLATQVEQAKLQVNKDTPVFTTIKPVSIPYNKSSPRRSFVVTLFLFFGFILSCFYVLIKEPTKEILKSIKS